MNLQKRLQALEAGLTTGAVVLHFADGSTRQICGQGDFLLGLFPAAFDGQDPSPAQATQLVLTCINQSKDGGAWKDGRQLWSIQTGRAWRCVPSQTGR